MRINTFINIELLSTGMCTGDFQESDSSNAGNGLQRPPTGTKCTSNCFYDSGRWGSSWCYTDNDNEQWGAECVECGSQTKPGKGNWVTFFV